LRPPPGQVNWNFRGDKAARGAFQSLLLSLVLVLLLVLEFEIIKRVATIENEDEDEDDLGTLLKAARGRAY